jgi:2-dehydro-3-deoxygluconokinase
LKPEPPLDLISLGEMMLRLSPPKFERLRRATSLELHACGAQFNIAANLASLGKKTRFVTKLPQNDLGQLALSLANSYGVDMSQVWFDGTKIGMVFVEFSAAPRRLTHLYDRSGSAASTITTEDFYWPGLVTGVHLAYLDGIFPALNPDCRRAALAYAHAAKESGCTLCFDVNYRESLWMPNKAQKFYQQILPLVDILVTNRSVSEKVFDFQGSDDQLLSAYWDKFGCGTICMTYREMDGLQRGSWRSIHLGTGPRRSTLRS